MSKTQWYVLTGEHREVTLQAAKQLSVAGEQAPPESLSRPFTPSEFLHWLSWHETHGDLSLGEIRSEAESMLRSAGVLATLAR